MAPTIVLISGANRGLGKGLLELYLAEPNHIVIAANRDPSAASSKELSSIPTGPDSKLIVVKSDASVENDAAEAVKQLESEHGVDHIDLVIANAGVATAYPYVKDLKTSDLQAHIIPNVFGVVWLFQATRSLLLKAEKPKWVTMGSSAGWLENQHPAPNAAYAPTKAMVHWLTKRINGEDEQIAAFVVDPGWVQTDMGNLGARTYGFEKAPVEVKDSVTGVKKLIDQATKETHGGKMWGYDGNKQQW